MTWFMLPISLFLIVIPLVVHRHGDLDQMMQRRREKSVNFPKFYPYLYMSSMDSTKNLLFNL